MLHLSASVSHDKGEAVPECIEGPEAEFARRINCSVTKGRACNAIRFVTGS